VDRLRDYCHSPEAPKEQIKEKWLNDRSQNGITNGFVTADTVAHGNFPHHILLEGNVFYNGCIDVSHRTNGPHFFFRNKALGQPKNYSWWQVGLGIVVMGTNDGQVIVGNYLANDSAIALQPYRGSRAPENCLVGGNLVKGQVEWGVLPAEGGLPDSLYRKGKPSYWPEDLAWPPFGPDVEKVEERKRPAQLRYEKRLAAKP